ncbi:MAG: hypothetical protein KAT71_05720, partial [Gammaproteobacteria bacterium]|nr:hypothetical protein [Gammaproteobacteria bacterium]
MISWALHKLQKIFTRKKFPKWLSSEVEKEYKLLKGKKCFSILKNNDVAALAEPTRKCKFLLFFTAIFVLFLSYELPLKNYEFLTKSLTIDKSLLITTHAVICLIIFALLIFIVETAKNGFQIDKLRVLLYDSFIYPITVSAIYVFLVLLLSPASLIGIALIVLMGLFTIFSIGRTISLLLNSVKFTNAKQRMLKNRLLHCIEQETKERIGNNLLNAKFVGSNSISFSPFKPDTNSYAPIKLKQTGVITDINIAKLNKLLDESQNRDNENILAENNPQLSDSSKEQSNDSIKPPRLFLCPYCFDTNLTDGVVGWVDKEILVQIPDFHKRIARMIKIDESANSFSKNVKLEIGDLQKECINAINNKYINVIKECADLYVKLAITFSEYFYKINAGYSAQEAKQEVHSFVGGWKQIDWLQDHISALIEIAVSSNNINVVIEVIYIPFAIIKRTFKHYDHYIFQVFIRFAELIYQQKHSCCNKKIQDLLLDRTWRYLDEVNSFYLLPQLKEAYKAKDENKISSMKDFAIQFVWQATTLLRLAFEKNNSDDFVIFIDNIGSLYKTSYDSNKIIEELSELQQNLLFCLGAWMLYKYEASCSAEQKIMLEKIIASLPHDLEKITQLFLATHGEFTGRYAISAWYIILDGKAHSIPTSKWQQKFYWLL